MAHSVDGDADAAVEAYVRDVVNLDNLCFCLPIRTSHFLWEGDYAEVVMLHGGETWPMKKENELTLQRAEMRMIRCMCGVTVTDRFTCRKLWETRNGWYNNGGTATYVKIVWKRREWLGEMHGLWSGRPKETSSEVIEKDSELTPMHGRCDGL